MTTIIYRDGLGRPLTTAEMDANFRSLVDNKVEVVAGKGLSTNDYANSDKSKVTTIGNGAATGALADAYLLARANHTGTQAISTVVNLQSTLDSKIPLSQKGAANGVAPLDSGSLIPAAYLPSYVDDVLEFANLAAFPATGETGKIYVAIDTGKIYRWSSTIYVEISPSPGSTDAVAEGAINLYFTGARVLATVLAGLNTALTGDVTNTDTVLQALGRLQNKWNNLATSVRAVALTGLSTATATAVVATDSILVAIGKLQGQVTNSNKNKALIVDQKAAGTQGGSASAAQTRDLNTIVFDDIGITLSSNSFTLPAGTYEFDIVSPAYNVGSSRAWLALASDVGTPLLVGTSGYGVASGGAWSYCPSEIKGRLTFASQTTLVLRHYSQISVSAAGLGVASNLSSNFPEIYSTVKISKV